MIKVIGNHMTKMPIKDIISSKVSLKDRQEGTNMMISLGLKLSHKQAEVQMLVNLA